MFATFTELFATFIEFHTQIPSAAKNKTPSENGAQPAKIALSNKLLGAAGSRPNFDFDASFSFIFSLNLSVF